MRLRSLMLMGSMIAGMTATSGCVVAEAVFITTHTYHGPRQPVVESGEGTTWRVKQPATPATPTPRRGPVDVPAEAAAQ